MKQTFASQTFNPNTFASGNWQGVGVPVEPEPANCGTDMMENGMAWLRDQLQAYVSQPIIYQRGNHKIAICATFGHKLLKLDDGFGGTRIQWTDRDFLIPTASLVFSGNRVLPQRGDLITVNRGGVSLTYEVAPIAGEPPWQWSDPFHKMLRIHGTHVETVTT